MILVVSLSPALDVSYFVPEVNLGKSHSVKHLRKVAGGKGVNVASVLRILKQPAKLVLPLGGATGKRIAEELSERGLNFEEVSIELETRTSVSVVANSATVFNEPATKLSSVEFEKIQKLIQLHSEDASVVVFSGSIPSSIDPSSFGDLIASAKGQGATVIVDTSGEYLRAALSAGADWIKPNQDELRELLGETPLKDAPAELKKHGIRNALVSLGEDGAMLVSQDNLVYATLPKQSGNPTGAGDAMVAGLSAGLVQGLGPQDLLRQAVALGAAAVLEEVAGEVNLANFEALLPQVIVKESGN